MQLPKVICDYADCITVNEVFCSAVIEEPSVVSFTQSAPAAAIVERDGDASMSVAPGNTDVVKTCYVFIICTAAPSARDAEGDAAMISAHSIERKHAADSEASSASGPSVPAGVQFYFVRG